MMYSLQYTVYYVRCSTCLVKGNKIIVGTEKGEKGKIGDGSILSVEGKRVKKI